MDNPTSARKDPLTMSSHVRRNKLCSSNRSLKKDKIVDLQVIVIPALLHKKSESLTSNAAVIVDNQKSKNVGVNDFLDEPNAAQSPIS